MPSVRGHIPPWFQEQQEQAGPAARSPNSNKRGPKIHRLEPKQAHPPTLKHWRRGKRPVLRLNRALSRSGGSSRYG